jgi:ribosomal protein S12 methylthiotransferase accessory factor YcaO
MAPEVKNERISLVPVQTYRYSTEIKSLSLGQGTSNILPEPALDLAQFLDRLDVSPNDKWMWKSLAPAKPEDIPQLVQRMIQKPSAAILHILTPFLGDDHYQDVSDAVTNLGRQSIIQLMDSIPTLDSRTLLMNLNHFKVERAWDTVRTKNREQLIPLNAMGTLRMPIPQELMPNTEERSTIPARAIKEVFDRELAGSDRTESQNTGTSLRQVDVSKTVDQLNENEVLDAAMRGKTVIGMGFCGTYAVSVPWSVDWKVNLDRANYRMVGTAGTSGKGLTPEATTASGLMELAERVSAIAGATPNWPYGYTRIDKLVKARLSELKATDEQAIDPNDFSPAVPYYDQEIYWILAKLLPPVQDGQIHKPHGIWIPAQKAFHFTNLDEPEVLKDTSNGLASGNTEEEARLHALLEVLERDGCYTTFTTPQRLFTLPPDTTDQLGQIISAYQAKGLHPAFVDITTDFGIPAYKAYIQLPDNNIISGSGAHLNGRIALNRAMCELGAKCMALTYSGALLVDRQQKTQEKVLSDIPNLSSGNVETDLGIVESVLRINGYSIIYADLTRVDVNIPVVRAIVPELDCPWSLTKREVRHFIENYKFVQK